ncbi:hypothetical protein [Stenotrophomonas sp.]|uniref:hypothetical protein n=1 Tax=Stenotrophomonas sp. TaxID=69392 RepID=UPI0028AC32CA|nr:hypothetical protein [Stenotrophomonas sp.]
MKVLLLDYLSSLRERAELDAVFPDLLAEHGFEVFSRPGRGGAQRGVDVAATLVQGAQRVVYLFTIKPGDLTRSEWAGSTQAVRQSLEEIVEVYIPNRLPDQYREDKVVVCVVIGGAMSETAREHFTAFCRKNRSNRIEFEEWNGERLASMLMSGNHGESVIVKKLRSPLQKSIAMVGFPETSERHFQELAGIIRAGAVDDASAVRASLQLSVSAWMVYAWCRQAGNMESALRACEVTLVSLWSLHRRAESAANQRKMRSAFTTAVEMYLQVFNTFFEDRIRPIMGSADWLTRAVGSRSSVDVSLIGTRLLSRIAMAGLWCRWLEVEGRSAEGARDAKGYLADALSVWDMNRALSLPVSDSQAGSLGCILLLSAEVKEPNPRLIEMVDDLINRFCFAVATRSRYPVVFDSYSDLVMHPKGKDDRYFEKAMSASSIIPLIAMFCSARGLNTQLEQLSEAIDRYCPKLSLQLWTPDVLSDERLLVGQRGHGKAILLERANGLTDIPRQVAAALQNDSDFTKLSFISGSVHPLLALCCCRAGLPLPPQLLSAL